MAMSGTTIMGVQYDGGVILGADSRMTMAEFSVVDIAKRSGSAADSQRLSDYARYFLNQHIIELGQPATVKTAANIVRELSYGNKSILECGVIVAGWDKYEKGSVFGIPLGSTILRLPFSIGGSGSSYLYGFLDQAWHDNMSKTDAEELVVKAVSLAMARDGGSGGVVRIVIIDSEGVTRHYYPGDELPLYYEEIPPRPSTKPEPMAV